MTMIAHPIPFNEKSESFNPDAPREKAESASKEIDRLDIPLDIRCRLHTLLSEVSMEAWTRGYRASYDE